MQRIYAMHKNESEGGFIAVGEANAMQIFHANAFAHDSAARAMTAMCRPALSACLHCSAAQAR
jgi:hypothetical protein